jgi:F-type H+-transporting ATPase subunit alpha
VTDFETDLHKFMDTNHPEIGKAITSAKDISPENEEALKKAIGEFKQARPK